MKIRTQKRLLNLLTFCCLLLGGAVLYVALFPPIPQEELELNLVVTKSNPVEKKVVAAENIDLAADYWQRSLQLPLYDPPPVEVVVVKPPPRPVTVKLIGTVTEPDNSLAFVKMPDGSVVMKRIGDQVTDDPLDGVITKIEKSVIIIKRENDEIELKAEKGG